MALVMKAIEITNGQISVESVVGTGTAVTVQLPKNQINTIE